MKPNKHYGEEALVRVLKTSLEFVDEGTIV
jgi:hypothetical protein